MGTVIKLLIGGSPCTHWSIAQTRNRETTAEGIGWELFRNYVIARDKYQPDYFLYENNKSMSAAIREQITAELGVDPVLINSALVSAQNRQRLYWAGKREPDGRYSQVTIEQPEDRGILVRDILETGEAVREKGYTLKANYGKTGPASAFDSGHYPATKKLVRVGTIESGEKSAAADSQANRVYSTGGKSVTLSGGGGGAGGKTGLYAVLARGKERPVYEVRDGLVTINGKKYPVELKDGCYIVRKLTVSECKRLQTVPEGYEFPVSNTQAYKMLGNGWTVEVIAHIMSHFEGLTAEPVEVLSMYDGMSCGHIALDKIGVDVARYYATEIDRYAIKTTQHNYPETIQLGDAFRVRDEGWEPKEMRDE